MRSPRTSVTLPPDTVARVERVRSARAAGDVKPPLSAILRELVLHGLPALESAAPMGEGGA